MKADLTRSTFRRQKHYTGVRMQQGRVQLDADWNEQVEIDAHLENTTRYDVIGPYGSPQADAGFEVGVTPDGSDLTLTPGRLYVDGVLCELEATPIAILGSSGGTLTLEEIAADEHQLVKGDWVELSAAGIDPLMAKLETVDLEKRRVTFAAGGADEAKLASLAAEDTPVLRWVVTWLTQPDFPGPRPTSMPIADGGYLAYLDVWQQHVTALEDHAIRETALGDADTATRTRTVWQLKVYAKAVVEGDDVVSCTSIPDPRLFPTSTTGRLAAHTQPETTASSPCTIPPGAGYRRLENQLYRVEIHDPGILGTATFKWSRENGSVVSSWVLNRSSTEIEVSSLGRDDVLGFAGGDFVELTSDLDELAGTPGTLAQVTSTGDNTLILSSAAPTRPDERAHPKVRRWEGHADVKSGWLGLEDGVEVEFADGWYNTGDYWEIAARTASGNVEWPRDGSKTPLLRPPDGVVHGYCRLAALSFDATAGKWHMVEICRPTFPPLTRLDGRLGPDPSPAPTADAGIHVTAVETIEGRPLPNDSKLTVSELVHGIAIVCDGDIDSRTIEDKPTCLVTLDLPYPFSPDETRFGTFPVTLDAAAVVSPKNVILWRPVATADALAADQVFGGREQLLMHLTLKGNFLLGMDEPPLNVDGEVFGVIAPIGSSEVLHVKLPSGDGRRGGDLEMWFWLTRGV